jgi:antitoxin MazE
MQITIRELGNSKGVLLPKAMLAQAGLDDQEAAEVTVVEGAIMLRKPATEVRAGWAEAAKSIGDSAEDALLMGEFGNADDPELTW